MSRARSPKVIRAQVDKILEECGISSAPISVEKVAASKNVAISFLPFEGEGDLAGMLIQRDGKSVIGVNSTHHRNRQRFTIAHELGHLCLKHEGDVHIDRNFTINKRDQTSSLATSHIEIEANRFAAEILMPYDMIQSDLEAIEFDIEDDRMVSSMASKYGVSVQAMTIRLNNVLYD